MRSTLLLVMSLCACNPVVSNQPPAPEPLHYWISTSVVPWQTNAGATTSSRAIGIEMSANDTLDPIDTRSLEEFARSLRLRNAQGEWVDAPIVSTDYSQPMLNTARMITPAEIIIDAARAADIGWNALQLTAPVQVSFDGFLRSGTIEVPFRFDRSPTIRRIVFTDKSTFRVMFSELVDSEKANSALLLSSEGAPLPCTSSWEAHDPGTRETLFVSCSDSLPETIDLELVDGVISAGDAPVRALDGGTFAEKLVLPELPLDGDGNRVWVPGSP